MNEHKERKIHDGNERNAAWRALTPQQQLDALNERLGQGIGAERQREKLRQLLGKSGKAA